MKSINKFSNELLVENKALSLKIGDMVTFMCGYNRDIKTAHMVIGFDSDGLVYVDWDCYWFGINPSERNLLKA